MKKIVHFILAVFIFLAAPLSISGRQTNGHIARDGDVLHPGLSQSTNLILSLNDSSKTVVLDPDVTIFKELLDASSYVDGDTISYVQSATKHRFLLKGDTLSYIGFESRSTDFRIDAPVNVAVFPLEDGFTLSGEWSGHVFQYGTMILRNVRGISTSSVQEGWTLAAGADTLRDATRVTWTLDMAYADPDSVRAEMPDSVASDIVSGMRVDAKAIMSEHLLTERTLWFSEYARYPVMTDSRSFRVTHDLESGRRDTLPMSAIAIYYPALWQHEDTGEERPVESTREKIASCSTYPDENGVLAVGEPETHGGTVSITLVSSAGVAPATVTLYSDSGMLLSDPVTVSVGAVPRTFTLPVPGGWSGVMLVHIESKGERYTRKVIIQ